jgi:ATP-dependent DNA ligase
MSMHGKHEDDAPSALPTLYQKTATGSINYWEVFTRLDYVITRWGQVGTESPQSQEYQAKPTNVGRANERDSVAQAQFEAEALWKKKKRLKYFESIEGAEGTINRKPMLAQSYEKRKDKIQFPVTVQPKLDGFRCWASLQNGVVQLMSRGGKEYSQAHIANELLTNLFPKYTNAIFDGELYVHGMSLQQIARLVKKYRPESLQVKYHIYDVTCGGEEPWSWRMEYLREARNFYPMPNNLHWVDSVAANSDVEVRKFHDIFVEDGYEGAIIRTDDHPYRFGYRSPGLLKLKDFEDKEFVITGWTKDKDGTLMWIVQQEDGRDFPVRPMGTLEYRRELMVRANSLVGQELTVRFCGRTDENIPKFAAGVIVREAFDR